uniref:Uncharacterized protein n=1 Tax=Branchiostoma floridae TaxID=7739 RepID=C3Z5Y9_BRAFL|eukprot:XP_002596240.1 hypothetical protein BRAFLDRAFT_66011 [Branchiostoma floridae]
MDFGQIDKLRTDPNVRFILTAGPDEEVTDFFGSTGAHFCIVLAFGNTRTAAIGKLADVLRLTVKKPEKLTYPISYETRSLREKRSSGGFMTATIDVLTDMATRLAIAIQGHTGGKSGGLDTTNGYQSSVTMEDYIYITMIYNYRHYTVPTRADVRLPSLVHKPIFIIVHAALSVYIDKLRTDPDVRFILTAGPDEEVTDFFGSTGAHFCIVLAFGNTRAAAIRKLADVLL